MQNCSKGYPEILEKVIHDHVENAAQEMRMFQTSAFHFQSWNVIHDLHCRCDANLDGLRIAGEKAVNIARIALAGDGNIASVVTLLLSELNNEQRNISEQAVTLLRHELPEVCQAALWGLRLSSPRHIEPFLRCLVAKSKWDFAAAGAIDVLAFHRWPVQCDIGLPVDEEGDEVSWLLAEAGGRMPGVWNVTH